MQSVRALTKELEQAKGQDVVKCLKASLHVAIKLEFATIPPYLTAMWSIKDGRHEVAQTIKEIVEEEMLHMGLVCNMLVALGEAPVLTAAGAVPQYPGPLPGDVHLGLVVSLRRLVPAQLQTFMDIEYPDGGPVSLRAADAFETIGAFYVALLKAFEVADPPLDTQRQRELAFSAESQLFEVAKVADVRRAVDLIRRQGEGSKASPEETPGHLAHYYQFREVYAGAKYVKNPKSGVWEHAGAPVLMPEVWPMADIPTGGYLQADVPADVWTKLLDFDTKYATMLRQLEKAWQDPAAPLGDYSENDPVLTMLGLGPVARELMQIERRDRRGNYGPCFRLVK